MYIAKDGKKRDLKSIISAHQVNANKKNSVYNFPLTKQMEMKANIHLVYSVAEQFMDNGLSYPELINIGNLGLIKALNNFDETTETDFIAYAKNHIRQSIIQAFKENERNKPIPLNKIGLLYENFKRMKNNTGRITILP